MNGPNVDENPDDGAAPDTVEKSVYDNAEDAQNLFYDFIQDPSASDTGGNDDVGDDDVFSMVVPALERIIRQVERTLQHYALNYKSNTVDKILISGEAGTHQKIREYIGRQLELPIVAYRSICRGIGFSRESETAN